MAVSTVPVSVTITPDPSEPFEVVISTTDGTTWRYRSVTGSGVAVCRGRRRGLGRLVGRARPSVDPSLNASAAMITMATTRTTRPPASTQRQPAPCPSCPDGCADPGASGCPGAFGRCAAVGHVGAGRAESAQIVQPRWGPCGQRTDPSYEGAVHSLPATAEGAAPRAQVGELRWLQPDILSVGLGLEQDVLLLLVGPARM